MDALSRMPDTVIHKEPFKEDFVTSVCAIDSPGLQLDRSKSFQHQDPSLSDLISYFEKGEIPTDSTSARCLMATVEDYSFEEGVLYHLDNHRAHSRPIIHNN